QNVDDFILTAPSGRSGRSTGLTSTSFESGRFVTITASRGESNSQNILNTANDEATTSSSSGFQREDEVVLVRDPPDVDRLRIGHALAYSIVHRRALQRSRSPRSAHGRSSADSDRSLMEP